jgi:dipeptidase E
MGTIVAIGGGEISKQETRAIDERIIALTGKKRPRVLFVPTASSDSPEYVDDFINYYGKVLNCSVDILYLLNKNFDLQDATEKILSSDIIYVGGGNTLMMMKLWRKLGIDKIFKIAFEKNIVLCGLSAGAICWFRCGNSDSRRFKNPNAPLIKVTGLGLIDALLCPHYHSKKYDKGRRASLKIMMQKTSGVALAIDDYCAIVFVDGQYQVISSRLHAHAYKVYWKCKKFHHEVLDAS